MYSLTKGFFRNSQLAIRQVVFSKHLLSLVWGYAGMFLVNLLAYPILTNLYSPRQFGELAVYSNVVLFFAAIGSLTFEKAMVLAKSRARTLNLFFISLGILVVTSVVEGVFIGTFYNYISLQLNLTKQLKLWWYLIPLVVFSVGAFYVGSAYLIKQGAFKRLSKWRILLRSSTLGLQVFFAFFLTYEMGLVAGFAAGFFSIFCLLAVSSSGKILNHGISIPYLKKSWIYFSDFPKYSFPQKILTDLAGRVPFLIIPFLFDLSYAGYFSIAYGLLSVPESLVSAAAGEAFFRKISESPLWDIRKELRNYWVALFLIGFLPFFILFCFGEQLLINFLGNEWQITGSMMSYMAPMFLLSFIKTPTSTALMVMRKQKYHICFGASSLLFRPAVFYLGYIAGNIFHGLAFWVAFEIIQTLIFLKVTYHFAKRFQIPCHIDELDTERNVYT